MTLVFVDTHCHLNFEQFDPDRDAVVERAWAAGVRAIINPAVDLATSQQAIRMAEQYPPVFAQVGVHPNSAKEVTEDALERLREWARLPKVVAVGEIGLDYHWNVYPKEVQIQAFREQLAVAAEVGLPVVIHSRNAAEDTYRVLAEWVRDLEKSPSPLNQRPYKGVWHSFQGNAELAYKVLDLGFCISLGGPVTFKNARDLHALVPQLPLERLLLETDAPFLSPHPHRGQRNEPARIPLIAEAIAALQGKDVHTVAQATTETAQAVFGPTLRAWLTTASVSGVKGTTGARPEKG